MKLTTKFTLVTGLVLLVTLAVSAIYNVNTLERIWVEDTLREVDALGETIISVTHYQMMEDHRQRAYQMIEEVASQESIRRIRLFNKVGIITFSTQKEEVGNSVNINAEACNGCHCEKNSPLLAPNSGSVPAATRSRFFENSAGEKILGVTREIDNLPSCSTAACHAHEPNQTVLGILDVQVSLAGMQASLATYKKSVTAFSIVLLCILGVCLSILTQKFVKQPVDELLDHTKKLAQGDFSSRVKTERVDELGELSTAFDDMAQNLEQAQLELKDWGRTLEDKVELRTEEIQKMQAQLIQSAKLASLGELVAGIAHEINNPLSGILLFTSLAAGNKNVDPALKRDLEVIRSETQRCSGIVQGLLEFSRSSIPEKKSASVARVIDDTLELLSQQPILLNVRILKDYAENLPEIQVDSGQLRQVFMNLIMNACQAMPQGGDLSLRTGQEEEFLVARVIDSGTGIDKVQLGKIFDPFFTTKEREGTGLGLSISYGIIENHGGTIEVDSTLGEGTTFTIKLPIAGPEQVSIEDDV